MLVSGFFSITACNTIEGFGKDLEVLGEKIQKNDKENNKE